MENSIGIDFGSTYSTFASYDPETKELRCFDLVQGESSAIPSTVTVSLKKKVWDFGHAAKSVVGNKTQRVFEHFKMLLAEKNEDILCRRGYDSEYTPAKIAQFYLQSSLNMISSDEGMEFRDIVVCTPENWGKKTGKYMDGRGVLKEILSVDKNGVSLPRNVRVVTEPEAASAYFAYKYEEVTGRAFNGHLLLIDYGGGTLDLTLTKVESDGKGSMNIRYVDSGGAGENHEEEGQITIGNAGVAYMQDILVSAMRSQGLLEEGEAPDYNAPDFKKAVKELENKIKGNSKLIRDRFDDYSLYSHVEEILDEDPEDDDSFFTDIDYDEGLDITYQQLFLSYRKIIQEVLAKEITKINQTIINKLGKNPCEPTEAGDEDFKIALVGGFSNFNLVQKQIKEVYNIAADDINDGRMSHIDRNTKELAVALGAALIAGGRVDLKRVARYSIGMRVSRGVDPVTGKERDAVRYGIHMGDCMEPGEIGYCRYKDYDRGDPDGRVVFMNVSAQDALVINRTGKAGNHVKMPMRQSMIRKIRQKLEPFNSDQPRNWFIGFSFDDSSIIVFHVTDADDPTVTIEIPLARFSDLFESNVDVKENRLIEEE